MHGICKARAYKYLFNDPSQALKAATATCLHLLGVMGTQPNWDAINPGQRKGPGSPPASEQLQRSALIYLFLGSWSFFFSFWYRS